MSKAADNVVPFKGRKCPECGKPADIAFRPFCSKRCADLDLGRWLNEDYRVPTDEPAPMQNHGAEDDDY